MNVDSLRQLQLALAHIDSRIHEAVARARAAGHDPTDALRGLIISEDEVDAQLDRAVLSGLWQSDDETTSAPAVIAVDGDLPFSRLMRIFNLTPLDSHILLFCLAPELDRRYERLYAYLQDDVSQRRPTVNLMMNLLGSDVPGRFAVWERLSAHQPLRAHHLIDCLPDPNQYQPVFLAHQLKVEHRIIAYLLGDESPDERLYDVVDRAPVDAVLPVAERLVEPVRQGWHANPMIYLQGLPGTGRRQTAAALCAEHDLPLVTASLAQLIDLDLDFETAWKLTLREAQLVQGALLLAEWDSILDKSGQPPAELWAALLAYDKPVFLCGEHAWEPRNITRQRRLLRLRFVVPNYDERKLLWEASLQGEGVALDENSVDALASKFRLTQGQIASTVLTAVDLALSRGEAVAPIDLYSGAQAHTSLRLGQLASRIEPRFHWDDLILPPDRLMQLREICDRVRYGHIVLDAWHYGQKLKAAAGVSALFAGESGTGKTLAAEVIARELGLMLYKIDLSAVVSKYIGETEKNLSTIFDEAQASNAILFFDEADALFGKRSEVKDAHDRYANIEIAYLLQRIETYDGVAIMATNLRQNLDEAFTRRLDFLIDFPFPEKEYREQIWAAHFPAEAPLDALDLSDIADRFPLAGGNIRNAALAAAYLAAADGGRITMTHIRSAIRREHQKMGRLLDDDYGY